LRWFRFLCMKAGLISIELLCWVGTLGWNGPDGGWRSMEVF
jgi:hypothetical protein